MSAAGEGGLADRLRRLRREGGPSREVPGEGTAPAAGLSPELRRRLGRRGGLRPAAGPGAASGPVARPGPGAARSVGEPEACRTVAGERGAFLLRERRFPLEHRHGEWQLGEVLGADAAQIAWLTGDAALERFDPLRAVYLDIETTGLSGGAGTIPFLVALGRFEGEAFVLEQGFLRGPEEEAALLEQVAARVEASSALVSFFGKSFDRHRLEDKMRLHGIPAPFAARAHLDLYHPLRRLYGEAFPDGRLATMESGLCGVRRTDDLSGRFAPEAWFDFLAGRAHLLEDVFRHNEDDVLSLVVLAAHLGRVVGELRADGVALGGPAGARAEALARRAAALREDQRALAWLARARERGGGRSRSLAWLEAELWLRAGERPLARARLRQLAAEREDRIALEALVALAKDAEHALRDAAGAAELVRRAQRLCTRLGSPPAGLRRDLERRARRLAELRDAPRTDTSTTDAGGGGG